MPVRDVILQSVLCCCVVTARLRNQCCQATPQSVKKNYLKIVMGKLWVKHYNIL